MFPKRIPINHCIILSLLHCALCINTHIAETKGGCNSQILNQCIPSHVTHTEGHVFNTCLLPCIPFFTQKVILPGPQKAFKSKLHRQNFGVRGSCLAPETQTSLLLSYPIFQLSGSQSMEQIPRNHLGFLPSQQTAEAAFSEISHLPEI